MTSVEDDSVQEKTADTSLEKDAGGDDSKELDSELMEDQQKELTVTGEEEEGLICEEDVEMTENEEELYTTAHEGNVTGDDEEMDTTIEEEAGDKPATTKEQQKQDTPQITKKTKKPDVIKIQDQVGTIFQSGRYESILMQFQYKGRDEVAMASTRSMYINGSQSLLGICQRDVMLKGFLKDGDTVHFDAVSKEAITGFNKGKQQSWYKQPYRSWDIVLMWKGPKPDLWRLNTGLKFDAQEEYLDAKIKHLEVLLKEDEELKKKKKDCKTMHGEIKEFLSATHGTMSSGGNTIIFKSEDLVLGGIKMTEGQTLADVLHSGEKVSAFVKEKPLEYGSVTYTLQATSIWKKDKVKKAEEMDVGVPECWFLVSTHCMKVRLPGYDETTEKDQVGVIKEIHRPKGGIISLPSGKDVLFARTRLYVNKKKLGMNDILEDAVEIGDTVHCNILPNEGQKYVDEPVSHVALLVWKGEKPEANWQPAGNILHGKVLKLDHPQENGVSSGLLVILGPGHTGKKVAFDRSSTYFFGLSLAKADLAYLLEKDDPLFCTIEVMPENEGGRVTHKASYAWVGSASGPNITDNTDIKLSKFQMVRHLRKANLDVDTFEMLISGQLEPKHKRHVPLMPVPIGSVTARMVALNPPIRSRVVVSADLSLEFQCGDRGGHRIRLHRDSLKVWGISMDKADISYLFQKGDRVFCNLREAVDLEGIKYRTTLAWIGPHPDPESETKLETLEKDPNFNEWLTRLSLNMEQFTQLVQGKMAPRMFIPFKSESMTARIISVEPPKKNGIQTGTVQVQKGTLETKFATFHRKSMYISGYNMAKADIGYILLEGDVFVCELEKIFHKDQIHLQVVLMWNWSRRPTHNPEENTSTNLLGFENWLKKRGLNMSNFKKLVEGKLPPLPMEDILVPIEGGDRETQERWMPPRMFSPPEKVRRPFIKELLPGAERLPIPRPPRTPPPVQSSAKESLWRFKKRITECKRKMSSLLDTSLNITSLDDPVLNDIIQDEEMSKMTEFVSKGFSMALKMFNDKKGQRRSRPTGPPDRYKQMEKPSRPARPVETKEKYNRDDRQKAGYHIDRDNYHDEHDRNSYREPEVTEYLEYEDRDSVQGEPGDDMEFEGSNRTTNDGAHRSSGGKPGYRVGGDRVIYRDSGNRPDYVSGSRTGYKEGGGDRTGYREGGGDRASYREGGGDRAGFRESGVGGERAVYRDSGERASYRVGGDKTTFVNAGSRPGHPASAGRAGFRDGRGRAGYSEGGERVDFPLGGDRGDFLPGVGRADFPPGGERTGFPPGSDRPHFPTVGDRAVFPLVSGRVVYPQGPQRPIFPPGVDRSGYREGGERIIYREGGSRPVSLHSGSRAVSIEVSNRTGFPQGGDRANYPPGGDRIVTPQSGVRVLYHQAGDRGVHPPGVDRPGYPQGGVRVVYHDASDRAVYPQSGDRSGYREVGDRPGYPQVGDRGGFREGEERAGYLQVGDRPRYPQRMVRPDLDVEERKRQRGPEEWNEEPQRKWYRLDVSRDNYQQSHGFQGSFKRSTIQADVASYY